MRYIALVIMIFGFLPIGAQTTQIEHSKVKLHCKHKGIGRVKEYTIASSEIPKAFDNFTIAFLADIHYESKFDTTALVSLCSILDEINADAIMLGGDYQEGCQFVEPLFSNIMRNKPRYGAWGVMGNNDYERCTDIITESMQHNGIRVLENAIDTIWKDNQFIIVAGAKNTFADKETIPSPTLNLNNRDFVILLTHTPDYVEDQDITHTDIALAGHTHGGQVTLFGLYAPIVPSHYGQRFARNLKYNSNNIPVIISNGLGTSRKKIRAFAKSEVILIRLINKSSR